MSGKKRGEEHALASVSEVSEPGEYSQKYYESTKEKQGEYWKQPENANRNWICRFDPGNRGVM
jgi:hypothetical protein